MTLASSLEADLVAQFRVPGGWEVLVGATLTAGWLGAIHAPLAVLAPGPGGPVAHRTQLVVMVVSMPSEPAGPSPAVVAAPRPEPAPAPNDAAGATPSGAPSPARNAPQGRMQAGTSDPPPAEEGTDHALAWAAAAGIPEAWRIDEERGWTEVFRAPWDGRYRSRTLCLPGEAIVPLALTRLRIVPLSRPCAR